MFCNYLCKWNIAFFTNDRHLPISNINILIILRGHVLKWNVIHPYLKVFVLHRHLLNHVYKILEQYFYGIFKTMSIRYGDLFHKHFHTDYLFDFQLSAIFSLQLDVLNHLIIAFQLLLNAIFVCQTIDNIYFNGKYDFEILI